MKNNLLEKFHRVAYAGTITAMLGATLGINVIVGDDIAYRYGVTSKRTISEILPEHIKKPPYDNPLLKKPLF